MAPTIFLARPQEFFPLVEPVPAAIVVIAVPGRKHINPGLVFLGVDVGSFTGGGVAEEQPAFILLPVLLLQDDLVGVSGPLHARHVMLPGITGHVHPFGGA